jgi:hypothetical protein
MKEATKLQPIRTQTPTFKIPSKLLHAFENEVRVIPAQLHTTGWITFDLEMLISVLRKGDPAKLENMAQGLEELRRSYGECVIMAPTESLTEQVR